MAEMKSEHVVLVSAAGAVAGMEANKLGFSTNNRWLDFGIGAVIFLAGYLTSYDGVSDFVEGFGIGYGFAAVL